LAGVYAGHMRHIRDCRGRYSLDLS
jgi:hypothetical protein